MNLIRMAWRNLWRHPVRSGLIGLSVAIGLAAGLFVLSIYRGMVQSRLRTVIDAEVGHVQFHARGFKPDLEAKYLLGNTGELYDVLRSDPRIKKIGFRSVSEGMLSCSGGTAGVVVQGVNMREESSVSLLSDKIVEGQIDTNAASRNVLIGKKLAEKQRLRVGAKLVLMVVDSSGELASAAFRVGGIFQSSNTPFDQRNVYVSSVVLNDLLGIGASDAHECVLLLQADEQTDSFTMQYQQRFPLLQVEGWRSLSPETDLLVSAVDAYSIIVLVLIFLALSFGIINTLLMSVLERRREFGMMMALGMNRVRVFGLVMGETFLLVLAGLPLGGGIAWGVIGYYRKVGIDFSQRSPDLMRSFGFESVLYPLFPADRVYDIALVVLITTLLSGLFPAWRVLKWQPSEAMRK